MNPHLPTPAVRIASIDILRGFALLGILLAHFIYWYTGGPLPQTVYENVQGAGDAIVAGIHNLLIFGKFFAFFAFLFGISFNLQMVSLTKAGVPVTMRFFRRLLILFIIGMIHHFFWMGDILSIYALLGLTLLFFRKLETRALFTWGLILALALPNKIWDAVNFMFIHWSPVEQFGSSAQEYYDVVKSGTLWEVLRYNASQLSSKATFQLMGGRASTTIGFFLLGMWAARKELFDGSMESKKPLHKLLRNSALGMGCLLLTALSLLGINEIGKLGWQQSPVAGFFFGIIYDSFNMCLVLVYITGLALLLYRPFWIKLLSPLNYIGRLALTCYLAQTAAGLLLYYHFGAGLFLKTSLWLNYLLAFMYFSLQVLGAKWWLQYFYYGPVEWLWRSATIGKLQPFRRSATSLF